MYAKQTWVKWASIDEIEDMRQDVALANDDNWQDIEMGEPQVWYSLERINGVYSLVGRLPNGDRVVALGYLRCNGCGRIHTTDFCVCDPEGIEESMPNYRLWN